MRVRTLTARALLRSGRNVDAITTIAEIQEMIEKRLGGSEDERMFAHFQLASDMDVPENPEHAIQLFEKIWAWWEAKRGSSQLADVLAVNAGTRLVDLTARRGDLRGLEKYRATGRELALKLEKGPFVRFDGTRFHAGFFDLATARAILNHSPESDRLAHAEKLLTDLLARLRPLVDLTRGEPREAGTHWQSAREALDKEKDVDRFQHRQSATYLQADARTGGPPSPRCSAPSTSTCRAARFAPMPSRPA